MNEKLPLIDHKNLPFSKHANRNWVVISILFLLLIAANTYLSRMTIGELIGLQKNIVRSDEVLATLQELKSGLLTAESGQRGYLLTQDETYLLHFQAAIQKVEKYSALAVMQISQVTGQSELIQKLVPLIKSKADMLTNTVNQGQLGNFALAIETAKAFQGRQIYTNIHDFSSAIEASENNFRDLQIELLEGVTSQANTNGFISFITGLLLVVGLYFMARLNIRNQEDHHLDIENQNVRLQQAVRERTEELSVFSDELKRSNRELEDFAFVASHDLQEPLRKITAFGDRLLTSGANFDDKQKNYLKRMRAAALRMSTLISDLLEFSRINTRGTPFEAVDLGSVVESCIEDLTLLIEESQAQISFENLPVVQADPMQMRQLLFNLIANAIKFSKNELDTQISISAMPCNIETPSETADLGNWFTIRIKDNGIGFEQEYAEKIFAPFQRLHSRESFKGTGIGLAICRRIVERHNGTIAAIGKPGEGAIFEFTIPAKNRIISAFQISTDKNESIGS